MRINIISSITNVIRFVVDAKSMLRFNNLSRLCWHLRSSAGSLPGGSPRKDSLRGILSNAVDGISLAIKQMDTALYLFVRQYAMQPAPVNLTVRTGRISERSLRLTQFEHLTTTTPEQQRHS